VYTVELQRGPTGFSIFVEECKKHIDRETSQEPAKEKEADENAKAKHEKTRLNVLHAFHIEKQLEEDRSKAKAALEGAIADAKSKLAQSDLSAAIKARADAGDRFKDLQALLKTGGELESSVWANGKLVSESQIAEELANLDKEIKQVQASAFEAAVCFTLTLDVDFNSISSPEAYKTELIKDIALASNTPEVFFKFEEIRAGSIINDMLVAPGGGNPDLIIKGLIEQLDDPNSRLMQGKWTSKSMAIENQASKSMDIEPRVGQLNARFAKRQQRDKKMKKMKENASNNNTQFDKQKHRPGLYAVVLILACVIGMWAVSPSNISSALKPDVKRASSAQQTGGFLKWVAAEDHDGQVPEFGGLVGRGKAEEVKPGSEGIVGKIYRAAVRQFKKRRRFGLFRVICLSVCLSVCLSLSPFLPFARSLARSLSLSF